MRLPKHAVSLTIEHNPHKVYYMSVEDYVIDHSLSDEFSPGALQRAVSADEIWQMQWYPDTPVGSYSICAPSLTELLIKAEEIFEHDDYT